MPVCKKCLTPFPNRMKMDGLWKNLSSRKYCLACKPYKAERVPIDHAATEVTCRCGRIYIYDRKKGHTKAICNSCMVNTRRFSIKDKAIEYKGNKCEICGYDKCKSALEFHHNDPGEKEFSLSGRHAQSWTVIQREIDKCRLLCCRCHREEHEKMKKYSRS